jgi:hypothetical protein
MKTVLCFVFGVSMLGLVACGPAMRDDASATMTAAVGQWLGLRPGEPRQCNKMDIVFVIDDSGSMSEEQSNLATNFRCSPTCWRTT